MSYLKGKRFVALFLLLCALFTNVAMAAEAGKSEEKRKYTPEELYEMREIIRHMTAENAQCMADTEKLELIVYVWGNKKLEAFNAWYKTVPNYKSVLQILATTYDQDRVYRDFLDKSVEVEKRFSYNLKQAVTGCFADQYWDGEGDSPFLETFKEEIALFEEALKEERRLFLRMVNHVYPDLDLSEFQPE